MSDIETTLWSSLLRESSKKFKVPQAACVVIGDVDVGKSKLVDNMCNSNKLSNNQLNMNANDINTDIVSYNYLDYEEYDNDTSVSKIHIWTLGLQTFDKAFEILLNPKKNERISIIITLDLTKDNIIDTLKYWLRKSKQYSNSFHSELNKELSDNYKISQANYIQNIKSNKGAIINQQLEDVKININDINSIGLPIIVVGCKSDIIKLDDVSSSRKAKEIQAQLRSICLQYNCALIYTSAIKNINCQKLGKYIMHRLYHDVIPFPDLSIEDGTDNIFIPTGFDTKDLISIATGVSDINIQNIEIEKPITYEEDNQRKTYALSSKQDEVPINQIVEIETEDEWIAGLQSFINQVTATGSSQPSTSSANVPAPITNNVNDTNKNSTKRASVRAPVALEEKQDVDDFFKSLLKK